MELGFSFLAQWLTPSSLFLLLNLIIGTIVLTAKLGAWKSHHHDRDRDRDRDHDHDREHYTPHPLGRAASGLLDRVRSINLSLHKLDASPGSSEPDRPAGELSRSPSFLERLKSICRPGPEPETHPDHDHGVRRSKSDHAKSEVIHGEGKIMTKSASEKGIKIGEYEDEDEGEDEVAVERRRPATTTTTWCGGAEEMGVDEQADDFINRFKQQLRLQRMESLKRFREMIMGKGSDHSSTT